MILFYLHQSAHIIDKIRESDVELRPYNPYSPKEQSLHALLHKSEHMLYPATFLRLVSVAVLLFFRQRSVPVAFLYYFWYKLMLCYNFFSSNDPIEFSCSLNFAKSLSLTPDSDMIFLYFHTVFSSGTSSTL